MARERSDLLHRSPRQRTRASFRRTPFNYQRRIGLHPWHHRQQKDELYRQSGREHPSIPRWKSSDGCDNPGKCPSKRFQKLAYNTAVVNKDLAWTIFWLAVLAMTAGILLSSKIAAVWVVVVVAVGLFSYFVGDPLIKRLTRKD